MGFCYVLCVVEYGNLLCFCEKCLTNIEKYYTFVKKNKIGVCYV